MKASTISAYFTTLSRRYIDTTDHPTLDFDPNTALPCLFWVNNDRNLLCEDVRGNWTLTPESFSRYNPSVGLDCKPWARASYCVVPEIRLVEEPKPLPTAADDGDYDGEDGGSGSIVQVETSTVASSSSTLAPSSTRGDEASTSVTGAVASTTSASSIGNSVRLSLGWLSVIAVWAF